MWLHGTCVTVWALVIYKRDFPQVRSNFPYILWYTIYKVQPAPRGIVLGGIPAVTPAAGGIFFQVALKEEPYLKPPRHTNIYNLIVQSVKTMSVCFLDRTLELNMLFTAYNLWGM